MFIGHFAPAMIAATHKDAPSLPVLFIGAQLVDWVFFGLVLVGVEQFRLVPGFSQVSSLDLFHMPYTHSLVGSIAFSAAFGLLIAALTHGSTLTSQAPARPSGRGPRINRATTADTVIDRAYTPRWTRSVPTPTG